MQNVLERGTQASTSAVTASTYIWCKYCILLRGKSGPPTEVGRFVRTPEPPMRTRLQFLTTLKIRAL